MTVWIVSRTIAGICGVFTTEKLADEHIAQYHSSVPQSWIQKTEVPLDSPMCQESMRGIR